MTLDSIRSLLDAKPEEVAHAEFVGSWELFSFRNSLIDAQDELRNRGIAHARALTEALKKRFPFDYVCAYTEPGDARTNALAKAFGGPPDTSSTPFLPVVVFVLAVDGAAADLTEDELSMLAGYGVAAMSKMSSDERASAGAAGLLRDICRVLRDAGQHELAECIAEGGVAEATRASTPIGPRSELLDALYDARCDRLDCDASELHAERLAAAKTMLTFIDDELAPATRAFNDLLNKVAAQARSAIVERELALQHRRLTWQTAASMAQRDWPKDATEKWLKLAKEYAAAGSAMNQANALSCALDDLVLLVDRNAPLRGDLEAVLCEYSKALGESPWRSESHRRGLIRRAVVAELALSRKASDALLKAIADSLERELRDAKAPQREFILSTADDYLGVFLRAVGPEDARFKALFELLRQAPLPSLVTAGGATVLRFFVTRFGSAIHASTDDGIELMRGEESHELARTLSDVARRVQRDRDINECPAKKVVSVPAPEWGPLLARLEGRTGLTRLGHQHAASPKRVIVELDGLGVHLPIAGPLLDVWKDVEAIALTRLGFDGAPAARATAPGVQVLSGFTRDEPWDKTLQRLAAHLGTTIARFDTPFALQAFLKGAQSLVVVGAHGTQDGVAGALRVCIGGKFVPIEEATGDAHLPVGATVLCATCFAGSGQGTALHGWRSMPECLLAAGARVVVANRWPAWSEATTEKEFFDYVGRLRDASVDQSAWEVPTLTTAFMKQLRTNHNDARQWAGWGAWLSRALLNC
jgi:hypothetical protein